MSFKMKCHHCNQSLEADEELIGQEVLCPSCGKNIMVNKPKPIEEKKIVKAPQPTQPKANVRQYTTNQRINEQLAALGTIDTWFTKKEIKYLPEVKRKDEVIKGLASGSLDGNTWLIVVTNQRLLFLDKGMLYGLSQMEMDYHQISAVSHSMGLILASISVSTSGGTKKIDNLQKADAPKLSQLISNLVREAKQPVIAQQVAGNSSVDIATQLEKLANLLDKGILTQEEFQAQKQKILNS